jgi:signal transduction histidine kinase
MLDTANRIERLEMIGSAAAGIAHDINNQLTLIVNHLSPPNVDGVRQAVERCSALTGSLLSYCRGERVELGPVDLSTFLPKYLAETRLPAGVDVVLNVPDSMPAIAADPLALTRALTNLVSNACSAMEGKGELRITVTPGAIEVSDSGPGVAGEISQRIFEPFFSTKGARGMGLGLSIVREIMRQHGGSVTVHVEPGRGARFMLRFRTAPVGPMPRL